MPDITLTFADGTQHVYKDAPDTLKPEDVYARAVKDFPNQTLKDIARGGGVASAPESRGVAGEAPAVAPERARRRGVLKNQPEAEVQIPTLAEVGQQWRDVAVGAPKGAVTAIPGLPFDVAELVGFPNEYTSSKMADYMFGPAASPSEAGGRALGGGVVGLLTPGIAGRIGAVKEAAAAANYPKTAATLRAAQVAVDPLTPLLSGTVTVGGKAYNALRDAANYVLAPELSAVNTLAKRTADKERSLAAMRHAEGVPTSGGQRSVTESLLMGGVADPAVAAAQAALAEGRTAPLVQQAQQERVAAIQSNLQNVGNNLGLTARELTPAEASSPAAIQAALERQVAAEDARLQAAGGQVAGQIPNPNQQAVGQMLTEKAAEGAREASKVVAPKLYEPVIKAAGDAQIDLAEALQAAEKVRDSAAGTMNASNVPEGIRALEEFRAPPLPGEAIPPAFPGLPGRIGAPIPQPSTVTAEKFMRIRSALSQDVRDAEAAKNFQAARNTKEVIAKLDAAFKKGVSKETFNAYEKANEKFIAEVINPYRSGVTSQALSETAHNVSQILPEKLTKAFFESETPAQQFITTFGRDPVAVENMGQSIGGLFRDEVMGADGLVNAEKASEFLRKNSRILDILEGGGVRIRDQLTGITEQAATNVRQRQAFAERSAGFRGAPDAETVVNTALGSAPEMQFLLEQLNADQRAGLVGNIKNRALDAVKAGNPDEAIKFLTSGKNAQTIPQAIGRNGQAEYAELLNTARVQKRLQELQGTVPSAGIYDPKVLAAKFSPSQLADLNVAAQDIARLKQVDELAAAGTKAGGRGVTPPPAQWNELSGGVNLMNPLVLAKVIGGKFIKNAMDARVTAGAFDAMYRNPQKYTAALEEAIKMKKRGEIAQGAARTISNALVSRPAVSVSNALAPQEAP
jgi:hypothetical protein